MHMKSKFTYVGIRVADLQRSIDFYTGILGMKVTGRSKIEQTKGETVGLQSEKDGFILELNHYRSDSPYNTKYVVGEGLDHLAFKVDDLDKASKKPEKKGIKLS
jgi:catechol 2,3-dioxygenase-like lactoylglutathione lyase family enzyme